MSLTGHIVDPLWVNPGWLVLEARCCDGDIVGLEADTARLSPSSATYWLRGINPSELLQIR